MRAWASVSQFLPHNSVPLQLQIWVSMQMDAEFKKEQNGTLFVPGGAVLGGGWWWSFWASRREFWHDVHYFFFTLLSKPISLQVEVLFCASCHLFGTIPTCYETIGEQSSNPNFASPQFLTSLFPFILSCPSAGKPISAL